MRAAAGAVVRDMWSEFRLLKEGGRRVAVCKCVVLRRGPAMRLRDPAQDGWSVMVVCGTSEGVPFRRDFNLADEAKELRGACEVSRGRGWRKPMSQARDKGHPASAGDLDLNANRR